MIREATAQDLNGLLHLYLHLHEIQVPEVDHVLLSTWDQILRNENYHLIVAEEDGIIVSSCTCLIVPNLTRQGTPYALVENVVTHEDYRGRGLASACMAYASELATEAGCYKIMLTTGSQDPNVHAFYQKHGYSNKGKTAYNKSLKEVTWR